jgi:predicted nucleic acid-binding protein
MRILLDADTLLEYILNRSMFIHEVENLEESIKSSLTEIYISKLGLDKINNSMKALSGERASKEMANLIKKAWKIKILKTSQSATKKARELPLRDFESAVEVVLADKANISAVVTHKLEDFSEMELNVMTLQKLQRRGSLEACFSRKTKERPAVLFISKEVAVLNELYSLPSYTSNTASKAESKQSSTTYSKENLKAHDAVGQFSKALAEASRVPGLLDGLNIDAVGQFSKVLAEEASRVPGFLGGLNIDAVGQFSKVLAEEASRVPGLNSHVRSTALDRLKIDAASQFSKALAEASRVPGFLDGLKIDAGSQFSKALAETSRVSGLLGGLNIDAGSQFSKALAETSRVSGLLGGLNIDAGSQFSKALAETSRVPRLNSHIRLTALDTRCNELVFRRIGCREKDFT